MVIVLYCDIHLLGKMYLHQKYYNHFSIISYLINYLSTKNNTVKYHKHTSSVNSIKMFGYNSEQSYHVVCTPSTCCHFL